MMWYYSTDHVELSVIIPIAFWATYFHSNFGRCGVIINILVH